MLNTDQTSQPVLENELCCFHCGQAIRLGVPLTVQMDGRARPVCCVGCQTVSQAIIEGGLDDYYRHREAFPGSVHENSQAEVLALGLYDQADFQQSLVRSIGNGEREADLILEGVRCAACVWLNERHLRHLRGVVAVQANYATCRVLVRWREFDVELSAILAAVAAIGYRAYPFDSKRFEDVARAERQKALRRLFVAGLGMMQVMMYAYPAYIAADGDMSPAAVQIMRWASLVLTLPVVAYSAAPFFQRAWAGVRRLHLGMDFPVALGVGLSFFASVWATCSGKGDVYFDSVTMFVFFLLGGRYLEMLARQRVGRVGDALGRPLPLFARRISADGNVEEQIPVSSLVVGDHVMVRPGEVVVVDGVVCSGESEVDESWLTGESLPVIKEPGLRILSGSLNGPGCLIVETMQVGEATRFASIRRLIERSTEGRPGVVAFADRVASYFSWVLLVLAAGAAFWWWHEGWVGVLPIFVSVLVVSCPCALSLATPVSMTVATHVLAKQGILVTRAHAVETLARINHFVFDKTGTLTTGKLKLGRMACAQGKTADAILDIAAALEAHSEHLIARVFCAQVQNSGCATELKNFPGMGLEGRVNGTLYVLGRESFVAERVKQDKPLYLCMSDLETCVYLASESEWLAVFSFEDEVRPEAADLVRGLQAARCEVSILSGDAVGPVSVVAENLGVSDAHAGLLPEDKQALVSRYQTLGKVVAMVGDGVNDAPVLAQAHLSIAMAGGVELARSQADILLLNDDLKRLAWAVDVAARTMKIVRQNLLWALFYNLIAIPAAMVGLVSPWLAGLGMGLSSVLVILNSLRISKEGGRSWKVVSIS